MYREQDYMNNNWKCEYNRLGGLFLDNSDSNSSLLMYYLSNMLEELNKSNNSAYIGGSADHDYSFLRNDGFVPEKGEKAEIVLSTALRALHGGLKWTKMPYDPATYYMLTGKPDLE